MIKRVAGGPPLPKTSPVVPHSLSRLAPPLRSSPLPMKLLTPKSDCRKKGSQRQRVSKKSSSDPFAESPQPTPTNDGKPANDGKPQHVQETERLAINELIKEASGGLRLSALRKRCARAFASCPWTCCTPDNKSRLSSGCGLAPGPAPHHVPRRRASLDKKTLAPTPTGKHAMADEAREINELIKQKNAAARVQPESDLESPEQQPDVSQLDDNEDGEPDANVSSRASGAAPTAASPWSPKANGRLAGAAARGTAAAHGAIAAKTAAKMAKEAGGRYISNDGWSAIKNKLATLEAQNKRLQHELELTAKAHEQHESSLRDAFKRSFVDDAFAVITKRVLTTLTATPRSESPTRAAADSASDRAIADSTCAMADGLDLQQVSHAAFPVDCVDSRAGERSLSPFGLRTSKLFASLRLSKSKFTSVDPVEPTC